MTSVRGNFPNSIWAATTSKHNRHNTMIKVTMIQLLPMISDSTSELTTTTLIIRETRLILEGGATAIQGKIRKEIYTNDPQLVKR